MTGTNLNGLFHVTQVVLAELLSQRSRHVVKATYEGLAKRVPEGRLGEVKDIVEAVLYFESASFVTGEILHVDGGSAAGAA